MNPDPVIIAVAIAVAGLVLRAAWQNHRDPIPPGPEKPFPADSQPMEYRSW